MANRVLRDWTQSEKIDKLSDKAEVMFTRLIMKADDYGRFYGNVKLIKAALFPLKQISENEISKLIKELVDSGIILLYIVDNKHFVEIIDFNQRLRIMQSKFPQPNDGDLLTNDGDTPLEKKGSRNELEIETKRIVSLLNKIIGSDFKENTKSTIEIIKARLSDGFSVSDFETVIVFKNWQWALDEKMKGYLRPQTLFGTKFESYLQEAKKSNLSTIKNDEEENERLLAGFKREISPELQKMLDEAGAREKIYKEQNNIQ